jgi:serine/threonine kinase 32
MTRLERFAGMDPNFANGGSPSDWTQPQLLSQDQPEGSGPKPMSRRSTSRRRKNSKSQPPSPSGSLPNHSNYPPLPNGQPSSKLADSKQTGLRQASSSHSAGPAVPLSPYQQSYSRPQRPTGTRKESMGGGMQVVLGETGSWSELAKQDTTLPADAKLEVSSKPTGMLSFLKSKKGRGHSPKPQERGIMSNKEGGRIIIANGD